MPVIVEGDIVQMRVDAVVNAANSSLLGGGGVDGAIHSAAGPELLAECRKLGGCRTGDAVATRAYMLPARWIIHAVGPVWRGGSSDEHRLLASCHRRSLELASALGCRSVAFPAIGTGAFGWPPVEAAEVASRAILEYLRACDTPLSVLVVCRPGPVSDAYRKALAHSEDLAGGRA